MDRINRFFTKTSKICFLLKNLKNAPLTTEEERCDLVIAKYVFALGLAIGVIVNSYCAASLINKSFSFSVWEIAIFQTIGLAITAIGVWGQTVVKIQGWGCESKAEQLDDWISKMLCVAGFHLTFCSYFLVPTGIVS